MPLFWAMLWWEILERAEITWRTHTDKNSLNISYWHVWSYHLPPVSITSQQFLQEPPTTQLTKKTKLIWYSFTADLQRPEKLRKQKVFVFDLVFNYSSSVTEPQILQCSQFSQYSIQAGVYIHPSDLWKLDDDLQQHWPMEELYPSADSSPSGCFSASGRRPHLCPC